MLRRGTVFQSPSAALRTNSARDCAPLRKLRSWQTVGRVLEPRGLKPRQSKGCPMMNGEQQPEEGCDSGLSAVRVNLACSRRKEETTPWHAQKAHGELEYMTEYETALQDKFAKWRPRLTWKESHRSGEDRRGRHGPGEGRIAMVGRNKKKTNGCGECLGSGPTWWVCCHPGRERTRKIWEQERNWPGHGETDHLRIGWETRPASPRLKLVLNAATALQKLRLTLERTLMRAEADALNATNANDEQVSLTVRSEIQSANAKVM